MDAVTLATLITTVGGLLTLVLNSVIKNKSSRQDELSKLRNDLQIRLEAREATIEKMRADYDALQERYYAKDREGGRIEEVREQHKYELARLEGELMRCQSKLQECETKLRGGS